MVKGKKIILELFFTVKLPGSVDFGPAVLESRPSSKDVSLLDTYSLNVFNILGYFFGTRSGNIVSLYEILIYKL